MAKIEDCPGFETFGADVKAARKAKQLSRSALADMIHCDSRYLANIENEGTLPSLPVVIQLIKICGLPVERYFNPELMREESAERQRVSHKLQLCPEEYLPIVEGAIDGALRIHEQEKEPVCVLRAKRGCCGVIVVGRGNVASIGSVATPGRNACWGVPQTPKKRGETMTNRTRKIVLRVPVTPEEQELIRQKMALLHTRNFSAYARKMLIDGYVVHIDTTDIRAQTAELQKIGVNINQIARRLNSMGPLYTQDVADIKGALAQIWQLQRYILSSQR